MLLDQLGVYEGLGAGLHVERGKIEQRRSELIRGGFGNAATVGKLAFHDIGDELALQGCLLYTSDAADERSSVDLGGRRIIKKKTAEIEKCGDNINADTRNDTM